MLLRGHEPNALNEQTIELITERVIAALRQDLEAVAAELAAPATTNDQLTVGQVARQLRVARSTVYAHWREWGGYKLGPGEKAPIRFDGSSLTIVKPDASPERMPDIKATPKRKPQRRARRRDLLVDAPKLVRPLDAIA